MEDAVKANERDAQAALSHFDSLKRYLTEWSEYIINNTGLTTLGFEDSMFFEYYHTQNFNFDPENTLEIGINGAIKKFISAFYTFN